MLEYGAIYEDLEYSDYLNYPFCAFKLRDKIYITDAFNNRIIVQSYICKEYEIIHIDDWFPRWIQVTDDGKIYYVDSKKKCLGELINGKVNREILVPMKEPLFLTVTENQTILVGGRGESPLIEYDFELNILSKLLNANFSLQSAQYMRNGDLLVCDIEKHQVLICDILGEIKWSFGKECFPGEKINELSSPKFSCCYNDTVYIADGMNGRVLIINLLNNSVSEYLKDQNDVHLWWPTCIQAYDKYLLITDACNNRIIELCLEDYSSKQWGKSRVKSFYLNNPRGIEIADDYIYVADTYSHRIIKMNFKLEAEMFYGGKRGNGENELFWPRAIRQFDSNHFLIADSRNSRIIKVDKSANFIDIIQNYKKQHEICPFLDPHDIDVNDGIILITDSKANKIIALDQNNNCVWSYGDNGELKDPHYARFTKDNNILISDTGNHRVIKINWQGSILFEITSTDSKSLNLPRCVEEIGENLLITDSGNNRIIITDIYGHIKRTFGCRWEINDDSTRVPRCARRVNDKVVVSDTYNNRILLIDMKVNKL